MALISVDPFSWIDQLRRTTKLFEWCSLIFQVTYSCIFTFMSVGGTTMLTAVGLGSQHPVVIAIGTAMIWVAIVMGVFFRRSPLTKGMLLVGPQAEANQEVKSDVQIVQK